LDEFHVLTTSNVFGAFKKQVLKKVGKARAVGFFVFGTYVVQYADCHNGRRVVLVQDNMQTVFEVVLFKGNLALG
jgi:hypothetical protein